MILADVAGLCRPDADHVICRHEAKTAPPSPCRWCVITGRQVALMNHCQRGSYLNCPDNGRDTVLEPSQACTREEGRTDRRRKEGREGRMFELFNCWSLLLTAGVTAGPCHEYRGIEVPACDTESKWKTHSFTVWMYGCMLWSSLSVDTSIYPSDKTFTKFRIHLVFFFLPP